MNKSFPENDYVTKKEFSPVAKEVKETVKELKKTTKELKETTKEVKEIRRILNPMRISILNMEAKMNMYSDMYEINNWNNTKLANRVNRIEKHIGVTPSEEFLISGL